MKYTVSVAIDARMDVAVEAESFEEAKTKAQLEASDCSNEEWISVKAVNAEDENGNFIDY